MAKRIATYLRANVLGLIALFIALGAGAYAAGLPKNSVKSKQIKAGAVKNAELGRDAVTSKKVADGSLLGADFAAGELPQGPQGEQGAPATKLFAYVSADGTLQYGSGATGATRTSTGQFRVQFDRDLSGCVAMATGGAGDPQGNPISYAADSMVNARDITADDQVEIWVQESPTGSYSDRAFMVAVFC